MNVWSSLKHYSFLQSESHFIALTFFKLTISKLDFKCQKPSCKEGYPQGIATPELLRIEIQMKSHEV